MREEKVGVASKNDENRTEPDFRPKLVAALALRVHPKSIFFFPQASCFNLNLLVYTLTEHEIKKKDHSDPCRELVSNMITYSSTCLNLQCHSPIASTTFRKNVGLSRSISISGSSFSTS
jgi:hypothetical protein